jgi:hypothetical protein
MTKVIRGVFALFLIVFLGACPTDASDDGLKGNVEAPVIRLSPDRSFNNEPIQITLTTTTPDASIYYTTNGSAPTATNGTPYTEPFSLNTTTPPGRIQVRAIGIKEGLKDSSISSRNLQIFEAVNWSNITGTGTGTAYGHGAGLTVTLELKDGVIDLTNSSIDGPNETLDLDMYSTAKNHALTFWQRMNHWDFDTVSGATESSRGIREATRQALIDAGAIQED